MKIPEEIIKQIIKLRSEDKFPRQIARMIGTTPPTVHRYIRIHAREIAELRQTSIMYKEKYEIQTKLVLWDNCPACGNLFVVSDPVCSFCNWKYKRPLHIVLWEKKYYAQKKFRRLLNKQKYAILS